MRRRRGGRRTHAARRAPAKHVDPGGGLAGWVLEILGTPVPASNRPQPLLPEPSAFAERLGTLLPLAAILSRVPGGLPSGIEPIWVIEDPEAHLHPMTLAAMERLLQRVRWQKAVTTHSGDLLSAMPLAQVRRLVRHEGMVRAAGLRPRALSREHLRVSAITSACIVPWRCSRASGYSSRTSRSSGSCRRWRR